MTARLEVPPAQGSETPATPVFATPIRHPSAWTVADFRSPADYSIDLDAAQLRDIADAVHGGTPLEAQFYYRLVVLSPMHSLLARREGFARR
jgi:hypothetical protein